MPPYTWDLVKGALPAGLTLDRATGIISGTPIRAATVTARIRVYDSARGLQSGRVQEFVKDMSFVIQ